MTRPTHQFSQTKTADIPRSSFDLSHGLKTTFNAGELIPILSLEVLPGDTINLRASVFGRFNTLIKPILDNVYLESFFFFTPYRQVWTNFVKFMGEQINPGDSIDFSIPIMSRAVPQTEGDLADYLGIPPGLIFDDVRVSALPFRCYQSIYNFWFRDENLIDSIPTSTGDGPDQWGTNDHAIQRRRKRRDYLTSGLPWPQKGDPVTIDLGGNAPVIADDQTNEIPTFGMPGGGVTQPLNVIALSDSVLIDNNSPGGTGSLKWGETQLVADLSAATGFTINDLRESFQIQKLLERDARGGTRYPEILRSHFRVSDPGLLVHQRPLFLGGGSTNININAVAQTTDTLETAAGDTPQANLAAYGIVSDNNHGFTSSFTEHGHIIGLVNVRADLTYQQGLERYWSRQTRYDFYFPVLSHLGEQSILNKEIFVSNLASTDDAVFSYMPRYDEYRFKQSQITALFRSSASASLDIWHLAQDFSALPVLSKAFIEDNPPIDRVVAVPSEPDMKLDVYFKIRAARPLPLYATPGLIDHF